LLAENPLYLNLEIRLFDIVSDFEFRDSDLYYQNMTRKHPAESGFGATGSSPKLVLEKI